MFAEVLHFPESIRWPETIQAMASVIALGLAIFIPLRIRNLDRKANEVERKLKGEKLAFFVFADIFDIELQAIKATSFLRVCTEGGRSESITTREAVIDTLTISAAQRAQPVVDRLWLLERNCGNEVNKAISIALHVNRRVANYFQENDTSAERLKSFYLIYKSSYEDAQNSARKARELLKAHYKEAGL